MKIYKGKKEEEEENATGVWIEYWAAGSGVIFE